MPNDPESRPEADVVGLLRGIIIDVQVLIRQQLALVQYEVKAEIGRAVDAGSLVAAGIAVVLMGSGLLCLMLVHLLARMAPAVPLWGCYGIVGTPVAAIGAVLCLVGLHRLRNFNTPTVDPTQGRTENVDG